MRLVFCLLQNHLCHYVIAPLRHLLYEWLSSLEKGGDYPAARAVKSVHVLLYFAECKDDMLSCSSAALSMTTNPLRPFTSPLCSAISYKCLLPLFSLALL